MTSKIQDNNKNTLKELYKNEKYFCPYCRILFIKDTNNYSKKTTKNVYTHKCLTCNKEFNRETYKLKSRLGKRYHLRKDKEIVKKDVDTHISKIIVHFWQEGHTIEDIHYITHFSEKLIGDIIYNFKKNNKYIFSQELFIAILNCEFIEEEYDLIPQSDKKIHMVRKALDLGCSMKQVAKLLKMSNTTITRYRDMPYGVEGIKDLDKESEEVRESFLTKAMTKQSTINKKSQRRSVILTNNKIIIRGMTALQKNDFIENYKKI
jgi:predicted transcriptional regulator/DNA-directed RNA polymerase subunit RPC12/RpoP